MKTYRFELFITEEDLQGDEFWEDIINQDPTGISPLRDALVSLLYEGNLINKDVNDFIRLVEYTDNVTNK